MSKTPIEIKVCKKIPLHEYFNTYVYPLKKGLSKLSLNQTTSICPFHNEKDGSFHYWTKRGTYKCFGRCNASGDVITLHQEIQKKYYNRVINRKEALKELINLYKLEINPEELEGNNSKTYDNYKNIYKDAYKTEIEAPPKITQSKRVVNRYILFKKSNGDILKNNKGKELLQELEDIDIQMGVQKYNTEDLEALTQNTVASKNIQA